MAAAVRAQAEGKVQQWHAKIQKTKMEQQQQQQQQQKKVVEGAEIGGEAEGL